MNKNEKLSHQTSTEGYQRGQRQALRTKSAILQAFRDLIHEKNYAEITIGELTDLAQIGRSTFYRYFQSKADVLVELHRDIFDQLVSDLSTSDAWLRKHPPQHLTELLQKFRETHISQFSLGYKLGNDIDYVMRNINNVLSDKIEQSLRHAFPDEKMNIPHSIVAQSISGTYSWVIMSWLTKNQPFSALQLSEYIHKIARSAVCESINSDRT